MASIPQWDLLVVNGLYAQSTATPASVEFAPAPMADRHTLDRNNCFGSHQPAATTHPLHLSAFKVTLAHPTLYSAALFHLFH